MENKIESVIKLNAIEEAIEDITKMPENAPGHPCWFDHDFHVYNSEDWTKNNWDKR